MTPKDQSIWKSLSLDAKKMLLGQVSSCKNSNIIPKRKVNFSNTTSTDDMEICLHELQMDDEDGNDESD